MRHGAQWPLWGFYISQSSTIVYWWPVPASPWPNDSYKHFSSSLHVCIFWLHLYLGLSGVTGKVSVFSEIHWRSGCAQCFPLGPVMLLLSFQLESVRCGLWISWALGKNAESWAPCRPSEGESLEVRLWDLHFNKPLSDPRAHYCLRTWMILLWVCAVVFR